MLSQFIVLRGAGGAVTSSREETAGTAVSSLSFDTTYVEFESLPRAPQPTSAVTAQSTEVGQGLTKRNGQRFFQRKRAWRACQKDITVLHYERDLRKREDGRFVPVGDWVLADQFVYPVAQTPVQRKGVLPANIEDSSSVSAAGVQVKPDFSDGCTALSVLPYPVRQTVVSAVKEPTFFHGNILALQQSKTHAVELLRMDEDSAVSVYGHHENDMWTITQTRYRLGSQLALGGRS